MKRSAKIASIPAFSIISFLFLRAFVGAYLFHGVTGELRSSGWSAAEEAYILQPQEVVTFEASYLFFKLGTVKFELLGKAVCHGVPSYRIRAFIDSYSGIPFVDYHAVYETCADAKTLMCVATSNDHEEGGRWLHTNYIFDYASKRLVWEQSVLGKIIRKVDLPLDTTYTDGLSFFYYVREACRSAAGRKETFTIPIVSDTVRSKVTLTVNEAKEKCNVLAFDYPLRSERMSGHIDFKGTFGVTGDFVGWISADSAEVPLRADLKVILGSIVVKLKSIDRDKWTPPRAE